MPTRLTISLPEELRKFVEEQVAAGGYSTASEYVRSLIQAAQQKQEEQERLEALLLEGLDSGPAIEVSPEYWAKLRAELLERSKSGKPNSAMEVIREALQLLKAEEERQQQQREELHREIAVGLEQLRRGEYSVYDDSSIGDLLEEIRAEGRRKLDKSRDSRPA